jgi:hypothetical protein
MMSGMEQSWPSPKPPWHPCLGASLTITKIVPWACQGGTLAIAKTSPTTHIGGQGFDDGWGPSPWAHWSSPKRSSPKLVGAITLLSICPSSLELFKLNTCNIKIKKTKLEIVVREKSLPFGLLQCAMERSQPKNEQESHIIHFENLSIIFYKKWNLNNWDFNSFLTSSSISS